MTTWTVIPAFAAVILLGAMSPGPDFAIVVRRSAISGRRSGLMAAVGIAAGITVWVVAATTGVAALLTASAGLYTAVKLAGAAYLVYLGARTLYAALKDKGASPLAESAPPATVSDWLAFRQGFWCNVFNPKVGVFFVALIPQFLPSHATVLDTVQLSAVAVAITLAWFGSVALLVGTLRRVFQRPAIRRALDTATGAILVALGVRVAATSGS
ncbi:LysE family translocator [Stackebrandtia nassauensis]|uniref:Lysine exporter protein (LYSE/YGGA) n=1 Tax=Stackebrandtia nassauensis (strain DSM 44728 / CIP 108903 / NRRL B-16338 / NBRC 102104 / LLR-40K-21) TaxID=446470 RepID=D3Q7M0_STANL|nr:LysE family translocator [Stackebrandtia nassauensis]ADD44362.1 Lysine exporter protein (LYSE/YGGA) [Stackebrandtia nassauensis DSM 44728]